MNRGPEDSARLRPVRAGQRLTGAGQLSSLVTVQPALNLIVAGVNARQVAQGVSLEVDATLADCMTVWFGYDPAEAANNVQPTFDPAPSWPASAAAQPTRRIFGVVKWGVGGGQQYVELDVSEGVGVTIPTNVCEAYAYSESTNLTQDGREVDQDIEPQPWTVHVHAAPGRAAKEARRTRQVVQPYLIAPEELCPQGFNPDWCAFIDKTMDLIAGDGDGDGDGDGPLGYFEPLATPTVPNVRDLEFNNPADAATMVTFNPGNLVGFDKSISNSCLRITSPVQTIPNYRMAGAYRDCPTGVDWSCWTKINIASFPNDTAGNGVAGGFLLFDNTVLTSPATADFVVCQFNIQSNLTTISPDRIYVQRWNDYQHSGVTNLQLYTDIARSDEHIWLRLRWINSSTTLQIDSSADGVSWRQFFSNSSIGLTPTQVGLLCSSTVFVPVGNIVCSYDFLRFSNSSAIGDMTLGRVV